jgi:ABC-type lipoprotein export system ATPase subunit
MTTAAVDGAKVRLSDVTHLYQRQGEQVVALRDVHLHVASGESLALLGPSGSGKSTLLSLIAGLQTPTTGEVTVNGERVPATKARAVRRVRRDTVGLLVQDPTTVLPPFATPGQLLLRVGDAEPAATLARYGLRAAIDRPVGKMSAGEQQRVALAVTMARQPALLLADEPTSRLDQESKERVVDALHAITQEFGTTVIAVTHDRSVAQSFPRAVTMHNGRVGTDGSASEQFAIVSVDGTIALTPAALDLLPPGSRVRISPDSPRVVLAPEHEERP